MIPMPRFPIAPAVPLLASFLAALLFAGCMSDDGGPTDWDPFPKPLGEALIPLQEEFYATYRYAEFDSAGGEVLREDLPLHVFAMRPGIYAYAFEAGTSGLLLQQRDAGGDRDSAGAYIGGRFTQGDARIDSAPVLWLPQMPKAGRTWPLSPTRATELVSADTVFWTEALPGMAPDTASPVSGGMQRHPTFLFKESAGDTLTYYHFRRGIGCVGFTRTARGKLLAAGSLFRFYGLRGR